MLACHAGGPGSIPGRCIFCLVNINKQVKIQKTHFLVVDVQMSRFRTPLGLVGPIGESSIFLMPEHILDINIYASI